MRTLSCGLWDLVYWPGTEPGPPVLGVYSLSHWTTREGPSICSIWSGNPQPHQVLLLHWCYHFNSSFFCSLRPGAFWWNIWEEIHERNTSCSSDFILFSQFRVCISSGSGTFCPLASSWFSDEHVTQMGSVRFNLRTHFFFWSETLFLLDLELLGATVGGRTYFRNLIWGDPVQRIAEPRDGDGDSKPLVTF